MAVSVEEAIAALATFSMEDDQPDIQGLNVVLSTERHATNSPIEYADVSAYRLSLVEDTKAINQLNSLIVEGREMSAVLYTYRSCVKALPQLPESMKQSQAELYLETYQVLDLEMSHLREIQRWQASAASKLAADMQRFSRPERRINGPTTTHLWSMIKLLDVLVSLDHLKNAKASIPNDFSWYKRTFTQVSVQWQDTDCMREELDDLQIFLSTRWAILLNLHVEMFRVNNMDDILQILILFCVDTLELDVTLLFPERHMLLRVLPVLVVLATSSEKDSDSLFKRVKINRLINVFKNDPVIPAFPDLHLSPVAILKELAMYFQKFASQARLLSLPALHEIPPRETQDYQRHYLIINHIGAISTEHNDFAMRFASVLNQIVILKQTDSLDTEWGKEIKGNMYNMAVEGFQLLSRWTGSVWEQCAWKFSHPCKNPVPQDHDSSTTFTDYEKVVRWNYTLDERKALVELVSYIKSVGAMMQKCDTVVADALWETIHGEVQDFVQNRLAIMLKTTFRKKKDFSRILSDMRTISADWMSNASNPEHELQPGQHAGDEGNGNNFHPRAVAPTAAQVHSLQFLVHELVSGGNLRKSGGLFGNNGMEIPPTELKLLESFFQKLTFFLHIMDYTATITTLTDLGFLWFREFYLETSRVIQFPIECSLPWMLVDHVIESQDSGLFESVLIPFDIYCDSAQHALAVLKQRFLYDEIEAEVDLCFDQLVFKISENIFTYYKSFAASKFLDPSFIFASDNGDKYYVSPAQFDSILKMRRMSLLGRTVDLRSLITHRMNKLFRENLDFLFERFESQDICSVVELQRLIDVLQLSHKLLSEELALDSFVLILREIQENISLVSFSSRLSSQILTEMQNNFLPNFVLCNTTERFVRLRKAHQPHKSVIPLMKISFYCGSQELNAAYQGFAQLYSEFFGLPHIHAIVKLLGTHSIPWLIRGLLDLLTSKIASLEPKVTILQGSLPKAIGLLPFDGGIPGCVKFVQENLNWASKSDSRTEILQCLKEIGSIIFLMGLLDIAVKEVETKQFMQIAPWLGLVPGADGQIQQSLTEAGDSPIVHLYKSVISAIVSSPKRPNAPLFTTLSKQAEATDLFYRNNLQTGSVLEYTLAFVSAELDRLHGKWNAAPKTGFIDITTTRDFYRIFSGVQLAYLEESSQETLSSSEVLGDSVAWGGCTIIYLLGQQLHFELFDFSYQLLNVAEVESVTVTHSTSSEKSKNSSHLQGWDKLIESAKKARRLNNHVFSMLKARCPLEEKMACAIKQSGAPLHRVKYENTISAFETLPQKGA